MNGSVVWSFFFEYLAQGIRNSQLANLKIVMNM